MDIAPLWHGLYNASEKREGGVAPMLLNFKLGLAKSAYRALLLICDFPYFEQRLMLAKARLRVMLSFSLLCLGMLR